MRKIVFYQLILLSLIFYCDDANGTKIYQWDQAHNHIGEDVTVEGVITYTNNIGKICFLNFHPNFDKFISILIFREYFSVFPKSPEIYYYLKKVRVHGRISSFKGKAQIKIYDQRQIEVVGEYERKKELQPCSCNYPDKLEITAINIGQGDATLVATPSKIMLIDAGESHWYSNTDALKIDSVIRKKYGKNCRKIDYVLITHFHLDHLGYIYLPENQNDQPLNSKLEPLTIGETPYQPIGYGGLGYLVLEKSYEIGKMVVRDFKNHNPNKSPQDGGSKTFRNWQIILESKEGLKKFHPEIVKLGESQIQLGSIAKSPVIVDIIASDGATITYPNGCDPGKFFGGSNYIIRGDRSKDNLPPSENDLSISLVISYRDFQMYIGGDLSGENYTSKFGYRYSNVEKCLASDPYIVNRYGQKIDVFRVNHHGSSHSTCIDILEMFNPTVSIFSVGDHNTYGHVSPHILDRVCKVSKAVYLTECGENIGSREAAASKGVIVVDDEYPNELEEDEIDDPDVNITVLSDGRKYYLDGNEFISH